MAIDPICLVHGLRKSEHECLYCCLCFKSLTREECAYLPDGTQHNVCVPCAEDEYKQLVRIAQERFTPIEWSDLVAICGVYAWEVRQAVGEPDMTIVTRRAALCERIIREHGHESPTISIE